MVVINFLMLLIIFHATDAIQGFNKYKQCGILSPPGRNTPGSGAPLQRPPPGPLAERENVTAPCARQACHRVCRLGQASLRVERVRSRTLHVQPSGQRSSSASTSGHTITTYNYPHYVLRSPCTLPRTLQHLSKTLSAGVMWDPPTRRLHDVQSMQQNGPFKSRLAMALFRAPKTWTCHLANQRGALSHAQ
jgi:hypothetical protein